MQRQLTVLSQSEPKCTRYLQAKHATERYRRKKARKMEEGRNFTGHIDKRVYEKWNRDLPVHHKFQVKLPFSRHADLKGEFFKTTKEWLRKEPTLVGILSL